MQVTPWPWRAGGWNQWPDIFSGDAESRKDDGNSSSPHNQPTLGGDHARKLWHTVVCAEAVYCMQQQQGYGAACHTWWMLFICVPGNSSPLLLWAFLLVPCKGSSMLTRRDLIAGNKCACRPRKILTRAFLERRVSQVGAEDALGPDLHPQPPDPEMFACGSQRQPAHCHHARHSGSSRAASSQLCKLLWQANASQRIAA